jgi:hypothetical protein
MSEEKRDDFKDAFNTALLCGFVFIVVGHLHSFFDGEKIEKSNKTKLNKNIDKMRTRRYNICDHTPKSCGLGVFLIGESTWKTNHY